MNRQIRKTGFLRRFRFSLIELLVVISIIAILASMLLPALNRAKETAQKIRCTSNLKGLGLCMAFYVNDYGYYQAMNASFADGITWGFASWKKQLALYLPGPMATIDDNSKAVSSGVFRCPAWDVQKTIDPAMSLLYQGGYAYNYGSGMVSAEKRLIGVTPAVAMKAVQVRNPSSVLAIGESADMRRNGHTATLLYTQYLVYPYDLTGRHPNHFMNILWVDGHVAGMKDKELRSAKNIAFYQNYYFYPGSK